MAKGIKRRACVRSAVALSAALAATLILAVGASAFDSLQVEVSPNAQATVPMTITATGTTDADSTLSVYVQPGGLGCGVAAAQIISRTPMGAGSFSYSATYTPPTPGYYSLCASLYRSGASTSAIQTASGFTVADAPPPPPSPAGDGSSGGAPGGASPTASASCVVPKLAGLSYSTARSRIHAAGCIVGRVYRPRARYVSHARKAAAHNVLSVYSQRPRPGTVLASRSRVALRITYLPRSA